VTRRRAEPVQLELPALASGTGWLYEDAYAYLRGLPDRSGLRAYLHLIRAPLAIEPDVETMARGKTSRSLGGENDVAKKSGSPERWASAIVALLEDGRPRTFNAICLQLVGTTADVLFDAPIDRGLWLACERGDLAWTPRTPIMWTLASMVTW
jgi:hypothetical protein